MCRPASPAVGAGPCHPASRDGRVAAPRRAARRRATDLGRPLPATAFGTSSCTADPRVTTRTWSAGHHARQHRAHLLREPLHRRRPERRVSQIPREADLDCWPHRHDGVQLHAGPDGHRARALPALRQEARQGRLGLRVTGGEGRRQPLRRRGVDGGRAGGGAPGGGEDEENGEGADGQHRAGREQRARTLRTRARLRTAFDAGSPDQPSTKARGYSVSTSPRAIALRRRCKSRRRSGERWSR